MHVKMEGKVVGGRERRRAVPQPSSLPISCKREREEIERRERKRHAKRKTCQDGKTCVGKNKMVEGTIPFLSCPGGREGIVIRQRWEAAVETAGNKTKTVHAAHAVLPAQNVSKCQKCQLDATVHAICLQRKFSLSREEECSGKEGRDGMEGRQR